MSYELRAMIGGCFKLSAVNGIIWRAYELGFVKHLFKEVLDGSKMLFNASNSMQKAHNSRLVARSCFYLTAMNEFDR